jgi:hypothetical protein
MSQLKETKKGKWDQEEDIKLVYSYALEKRRSPHAVSWAVIAKNMENRTTDQCRVHFKVLVDNKTVCKIACIVRQRQAIRYLVQSMERDLSEMPSVEAHKKVIYNL